MSTACNRHNSRNATRGSTAMQTGSGLDCKHFPCQMRQIRVSNSSRSVCWRTNSDSTGFFIGDHPGYAPEPFLHLTQIGAQTERIELGSIVFCASYRHPSYLSRLSADFDHLTNGRLVIGLGIGWAIEEFAQLGIEFTSVKTRQDALEEYLAILSGSWSDEPFSLQGIHWSAENVAVRPRPLQQPRPPLIIAGSGEKTTLRQVAQFADGCNFGPGRNTGAVRSAADYERKYDVLRNHCEEVGRAYDDILRTQFTSWLMIAETESDALPNGTATIPTG